MKDETVVTGDPRVDIGTGSYFLRYIPTTVLITSRIKKLRNSTGTDVCMSVAVESAGGDRVVSMTQTRLTTGGQGEGVVFIIVSMDYCLINSVQHGLCFLINIDED